jgi:hypothetical protein
MRSRRATASPIRVNRQPACVPVAGRHAEPRRGGARPASPFPTTPSPAWPRPMSPVRTAPLREPLVQRCSLCRAASGARVPCAETCGLETSHPAKSRLPCPWCGSPEDGALPAPGRKGRIPDQWCPGLNEAQRAERKAGNPDVAAWAGEGRGKDAPRSSGPFIRHLVRTLPWRSSGQGTSAQGESHPTALFLNFGNKTHTICPLLSGKVARNSSSCRIF